MASVYGCKTQNDSQNYMACVCAVQWHLNLYWLNKRTVKLTRATINMASFLLYINCKYWGLAVSACLSINDVWSVLGQYFDNTKLDSLAQERLTKMPLLQKYSGCSTITQWNETDLFGPNYQSTFGFLETHMVNVLLNHTLNVLPILSDKTIHNKEPSGTRRGGTVNDRITEMVLDG